MKAGVKSTRKNPSPEWIPPLARVFRSWVQNLEKKGKIRILTVHTKQGIEERLVLKEPQHEKD